MLSKLLVILFFHLCYTFDLPSKCVSDLNINKEHYNVSDTIHVGTVGSGGGEAFPTDAHYDVYGNLFFVEVTRNENGKQFDINVVIHKTNVAQRIPGLPEGISYSVAVDKKETKVYFGTGMGMYVYNYTTRAASPVFNTTLTLEMIHIDKHSNKYILENVKGAREFYVLEGDKKIKCHLLEALNEMAVDDDSNFYFIREEKLFVLKASHSTPHFIGNVTYQGMAQITIHDNHVFVASDELAYFHENDSGKLKVVANAPANVTAIAFDPAGGLVLGRRGTLLKYKNNDCYLRKNNRVVDEYSNW